MPILPYQSACGCTPLAQNATVEPCVGSGCLRLGYFIVGAADSAPPCGVNDTVDFTNCFCLDGCDANPVTVKVTEIIPAGAITVTAIDENSMTYQTTNDAEPGQVVRVKLKGTCGLLSALGEVYIVINDPCAGVQCDPGNQCNKCTGLCEPIPNPIDINVV